MRDMPGAGAYRGGPAPPSKYASVRGGLAHLLPPPAGFTAPRMHQPGLCREWPSFFSFLCSPPGAGRAHGTVAQKAEQRARTARRIRVRLPAVPPALVVSRRFYLPRQGVMTQRARTARPGLPPGCPQYGPVRARGHPLAPCNGVQSPAGPPGACAPTS